MNISELTSREGYTLVIDPHASERNDALGTPQRDELCAQACKGNVIAMRPGIHVGFQIYPVSHEIAEDRSGFTGHHQALWRTQIDVLCRWVRLLLEENARLRRAADATREAGQ